MELINKKEFAKAALNENFEIFMIYVATLKALLLGIIIHPLREAQIVALKQNKAPTKVLLKYSNFADVFSKEKVLVLLEQTNLNKHTIKLKNDKQLLYRPIYRLGLVKLKILKMYIKIHLKPEFIRPSKSSIGISILFNKKPDGSL